MNGNTKTIVIGALVAALVLVAAVVIWKSVRAMQPNAVYANATHGAPPRSETGRQVQTPMARFQRLQGAGK